MVMLNERETSTACVGLDLSKVKSCNEWEQSQHAAGAVPGRCGLTDEGPHGRYARIRSGPGSGDLRSEIMTGRASEVRPAPCSTDNGTSRSSSSRPVSDTAMDLASLACRTEATRLRRAQAHRSLLG